MELTSDSSRITSAPMSSTKSSRSTAVPRRLPIRRTAWLRHFAPDPLHPDALADASNARHLALVVCAPHVDHPVEAAHHELVAVVGQVSRQVRVVTALVERLAEHAPAPRVAEVGGVQPERA